MARTDNSTKAIACRVPMADYIKFLTEASNKNMSLSEWLLVKVYSSRTNKSEQKGSNSVLDANQKEIENLKRQVQELTRENNKLKSVLDQDLIKENESLKQTISHTDDVIHAVYHMSKKSNVSMSDINTFIHNALNLVDE